jgi:glycosyltransferase involved in cell wall biosynthesis
MRILLWSNQPYGACFANGSGRAPRDMPSGSGHYLHDTLAKGLAELGHEVFYYSEAGPAAPVPSGVRLINTPPDQVDILHNYSSSRSHTGLMEHVRQRRIPWVATCHLDIQARGVDRRHARENWIFVSRTLARLYGRSRFVHNGIDPAGYRYREHKENYFLFMSSMDWAVEKGLEIALRLAVEMGFRLIVAGSSGKASVVEKIGALCERAGVEYVGDVRGPEKADLLAGARALLHPTQLEEAFGLSMAEGLMSGTPVICSDRGACPEVISPDVGFVCRDLSDYRRAIGKAREIEPAACREKAMREYHYHRMAAGFVREYEVECTRPSDANLESNLEALPVPAGARGL